jgi:hypothetical protein
MALWLTSEILYQSLDVPNQKGRVLAPGLTQDDQLIRTLQRRLVVQSCWV